MKAVIVDNLKKSYDALNAVDGLNFSIEKGEIFGLLGPNGAGKSTTIKMLSGLLKPSSGSAEIMGHDVIKNPVEVKKSIGVVPETSNLYPELTCFENLLFAGRLYGLATNKAKTKTDELLELFGLSEKKKVLFAKLSSGMRRRLTMAAALIHDPPVLFLDEPTTGLDVMSARALREITISLKNRGITILLTTHYIEEADRLCDRVAIMVKGRIVVIDTPEVLKKSIKAEKSVEIRFTPFIEVSTEHIATAYRIDKNHDQLRFYTDDMDLFLSEFFTFASANSLKIETINTVIPSLEDAFVEITGLKLQAMAGEKAEGAR